MEIRHLTPDYAVSPQIEPGDVAAIRDAGFTTVICNRPDSEIPPAIQAAEVGRAVEAAGMAFVVNPLSPGRLTTEIIDAQRRTIDAATGPVLAYCASGNRSSIIWAMSQAGRAGTDELIATAGRWGYNLEPFRGALDSFAAG